MDSKLINKVRAKKNEIKNLGRYHKDNPTLSMIILSFNHKDNIKPIIENLRLTKSEEIVVCEDGSIDGSLEEWIKYLDYPNDFLIRSNDLHEIRSYDRAIKLARGELVCLLQDDDIPPNDGIWVELANKLFQIYPKLATLGGYQGRGFGPSDIKYGYKKVQIAYIQPDLNIPFMFIPGVNVGPIFIRRQAYVELNGFDFELSNPGESGIHFDYEFCYKAWLEGWQVGLYSGAEFERRIGHQGTQAFGSLVRRDNSERNKKIISDRYWDKYDYVTKIAQGLNDYYLKKLDTF